MIWHWFFQSQISNNCISRIVGQIDASKKEVNQLGTGLTVIHVPCPITTPMNLTFKFQIKACVSKMNAVARARSTFQMLTLLRKYLYHQSQYSTRRGSKCLALIAQQVRAFGINPKVGGSRPLRSRRFPLKNFDTFPRTTVRVSKMNTVARTQLAFQMLTLLQKYLYRQSQYSTTWDSKCLALIAQ